MSSEYKRRSILQGFNDSFKKKLSNIKINDNDITEYYYVYDFENTSDKDCIRFDKMNEKIYLNNLKIFNDTNNKLSKLPTKLKLNDPPKPPKYPSNLEKLYIWRQRNIKLNVYNQTVSILYLLSNNINIKLNDIDEGIEPHDAINIATQISNGKNMINDVNNFLKRLNLNTTISDSIVDNNFTCSVPEHHNVSDKINFYSNHIYPSLDSFQLEHSRAPPSAPPLTPPPPPSPPSSPPSTPPPPAPPYDHFQKNILD